MLLVSLELNEGMEPVSSDLSGNGNNGTINGAIGVTDYTSGIL